MKNILLLLSFVALVQFSASGQFGVRAGLNLSSVSIGGEDAASISSAIENATTFHLGAFYELALSEQIDFRPAALFNVKGFSVKGFKDPFSFSYLQVPLDLSFAVFGNETLDIDLNVGPYFSFLLAAQDFDGDDIKDETRGTDLGFNAGVSADIGNIIVGFQYDLGLANAFIGDDNDDQTIKHRVISLYAGYKF